MATDQRLIDALLHERAGYARGGRKGRVAQVDAELKRLGYTPEPIPVSGEPVEPGEPPKRRAPRGRQTASQSVPQSKGDGDKPNAGKGAEPGEAEVADDGDSDSR